jgi:hypothetical protein
MRPNFSEIAIVMQLETALLHLFWCLSSGQEFHFPLMLLNYLFSPSNDKQFYLSSKRCWHQTLGRLTISWKPELAAL